MEAREKCSLAYGKTWGDLHPARQKRREIQSSVPNVSNSEDLFIPLFMLLHFFFKTGNIAG